MFLKCVHHQKESTFSYFQSIKSNFENDELFLVFAFYVLLIVLNIKIFNFLKNKKKIYKNIYLSFIITIGLDNHLGLFYGLIQSNVVFFLKHFTIIYIPALIVKYSRDYYTNQDKSIRITYDYKLVFSNIYNRKSEKITPFYIPGTFSVIEIKYGNNILVEPEIIGLISDKFNIHISRCSKYTEAIKACF